GLMLTLIEGQPVLSRPTPLRVAQLAVKRCFDIAFSLLALILFLPGFVAVAMFVRLSSSGPVFFSQPREGLNGQPIGVLKFRTMYVDRCDVTGVMQTVRDDPRVTPVGRFLRRTSIDELPQLINVLK